MTWFIKKFPLFNTNPYLGIFFSVSVATFIFGFMVFSFVYLFSGTEVVKAQTVQWSPSKEKAVLEVHIANNGMVYLKGASVDSISNTTLVVSTTWNNVKMIWNVETNGSSYGTRHFGTSFLDSKGNKIGIENLHVGETIRINGTLDVQENTPTIQADVIRTSQ